MENGITFTRTEISRYYELRVPDMPQRGREWRGPCPIHKGKDPNFAVEPDTGRGFANRVADAAGIFSISKRL